MLLLLSCNSPNAEEQARLFTSFSDAEHGYQFSHPRNWQARIYRSGIVVSEVNHPNGSSGVQFRITNLSQSIEQFSTSYTNKSTSDLNGDIIKNQMITINDIPCLELELTANRSGKKYYLYQLVYFFENQNKVMIIQAGCQTSDQSTIAPIIQKIAKSVNICQANKL